MNKHIIFILCFAVSTVFCDTATEDCELSISDPSGNNFTSHISFLYFLGPTVNDYIKIPYKNGLTILEQEKFNVSRETVFYFHGWTEQPSNHTESIDTIAEAFLSVDIVNLVVLDYSELVQGGSLTKYLDAFNNVSEIGNAIGQFLKTYTPEKQAIELVHLIGHSMGSQVMSHAARCYGQEKLEWLTALDPAGPIFNLPLVEHLSKTDGKFVDVIHTDAFAYGDGRSIGHVDFFPNLGRRIQPWCPTNNTYEFCSHHMSWRFYAESIKNYSYYPARKCNYNWFCNTFGINSNFPYCCDKDAMYNTMGYSVNKTYHGDFYLKTSPIPPYDLGEKGLYG